MAYDLLNKIGSASGQCGITNRVHFSFPHLATKKRKGSFHVEFRPMIIEWIVNSFCNDVRQVLDDWIYTKINDRWKDHKYHVKKAAYEKWNPMEERLVNPPHNVVESQWRVFVEVWDTDLKKQALCQINKGNKEKQKFHHTTGSKPHLGKKLGRRPKRHEVFGITHTKKKRTEDPNEVLMDPEVDVELKEMEGVEIQASQPGYDIVLQGRHDAFSQVRGRDKGGRVCCLGNGIEPNKYWSEESSTNPTTDPNAEVLNLRQQLENSVAEHQVAMQRIADFETLLAHDDLGTANTAYQVALIRIVVFPEMEAELR
ncbi:hypothetical protein MKW98_020789 [Papaver atlanticum]|uniref:Transposase n=1 Tax=Papaver atlanticum TaxID=357466 RepID=A0AAD4XYD8_9MAGN|nr:hypothetical protein MKW98_020789 [Papaver atlanticum]